VKAEFVQVQILDFPDYYLCLLFTVHVHVASALGCGPPKSPAKFWRLPLDFSRGAFIHFGIKPNGCKTIWSAAACRRFWGGEFPAGKWVEASLESEKRKQACALQMA
jgi:hypothetical protein